MIKPWIKITLSLVILGVMLAWLSGAFNEKTAANTSLEISMYEGNTQEVVSITQPIIERVSASVTAQQTTLVESRVLSRIVGIHVRAGQVIDKNQLLVELENTDYKAAVEQVQQQLVASQARSNEAKQVLERTENLHHQKLMSTQSLETAQANFADTMAKQLALEEQLKQAQTNLGYTVITSPMAGVVIERHLDVGDLAQPNKTIVSIYNPNTLQVSGYVREHSAIGLNVGDEIRVSIPSLGQDSVASIEEIVPAANVGARSFLVKARIDNNERLKPGMYAVLDVELGHREVVVIPKSLVKRVGQLTFVSLVKDHRINRQYITLGKVLTEDLVEVISGLTTGDNLAVN